MDHYYVWPFPNRRENLGALEYQRSNGAFGVVLDCSQGGNFVRL